MIALERIMPQQWLLGFVLCLHCFAQLVLQLQLRRIARDLARLRSAQVVMCPARAIAAACARE
jgi:hypothetical protein